jgi:hypothetical protein
MAYEAHLFGWNCRRLAATIWVDVVLIAMGWIDA